jgi:16S rRNA (guanine966-N2)-methyltransferase
MLSNMMDLEGIKTLDLFGGTGSISYELASRGAEELWLVERDPVTLRFIDKTIHALGIAEKTHVVKGDVFKFMLNSKSAYNFIFAGPPYALQNIDDLPLYVFEKKMLLPSGVFVLEHTPRNDYQKHPSFYRMKNYGTTIFTFFVQPNE